MLKKVNETKLLLFLETICTTILKQINITAYFKLTLEKRVTLQLTVLKIIKNILNTSTKTNEFDLKTLLIKLIEYNNKKENYEFSQIFKDIFNNEKIMNDLTKVNNKSDNKIKSK